MVVASGIVCYNDGRENFEREGVSKSSDAKIGEEASGYGLWGLRGLMMMIRGESEWDSLVWMVSLYKKHEEV